MYATQTTVNLKGFTPAAESVKGQDVSQLVRLLCSGGHHIVPTTIYVAPWGVQRQIEKARRLGYVVTGPNGIDSRKGHVPDLSHLPTPVRMEKSKPEPKKKAPGGRSMTVTTVRETEKSDKVRVLKTKAEKKMAASIPVLCINTGQPYPSGIEAARSLNVNDKSPTRICNGTIQHTHNGLFFRFLTPDERVAWEENPDWKAPIPAELPCVPVLRQKPQTISKPRLTVPRKGKTAATGVIHVQTGQPFENVHAVCAQFGYYTTKSIYRTCQRNATLLDGNKFRYMTDTEMALWKANPDWRADVPPLAPAPTFIRPVYCIDLNTIYKGINTAARAHKVDYFVIDRICKGNTSKMTDLRFRFLTPDEVREWRKNPDWRPNAQMKLEF